MAPDPINLWTHSFMLVGCIRVTEHGTAVEKAGGGGTPLDRAGVTSMSTKMLGEFEDSPTTDESDIDCACDYGDGPGCFDHYGA